MFDFDVNNKGESVDIKMAYTIYKMDNVTHFKHKETFEDLISARAYLAGNAYQLIQFNIDHLFVWIKSICDTIYYKNKRGHKLTKGEYHLNQYFYYLIDFKEEFHSTYDVYRKSQLIIHNYDYFLGMLSKVDKHKTITTSILNDLHECSKLIKRIIDKQHQNGYTNNITNSPKIAS
ncbi:MAG: hypothetical protein MK066_14040 [Crocinitomicaceae bacterium]|nr:hypothetical protein [Crocinitomicaceae bacterium]